MYLIERYHYHQRCLRAILNIHWSDFVTNIEVLEMAKVTSIEAMLLKTQLRWAGHVSRMEDQAYQRSYYNSYGELSTGHRDKGTPQKIYKVNRMNWRRTWTVYQATTSFKATRIDRRSGPVDVLDRHTGFESCAAVSHGQFFFSIFFQLTQLYE